jgi:HEAT repeat protein
MAALQALGSMGGEPEVAVLARVVADTRDANERATAEAALVAVCGRIGAGGVRHLLPLNRGAEPAARIAGLHALAACGGNEALKAVQAGLADSDEAVRDESARALSTWPNTWPEDAAVAEPLLTLARTSPKLSYQVLAIRGFIQFIQGDKKMSESEKAGKLDGVVGLCKRADEKRLLVAVLASLPTGGALELLGRLCADQDVAADAASAIVKIAAKDAPSVTKEQRKEALKRVGEAGGDADTKKRAAELLGKLD